MSLATPRNDQDVAEEALRQGQARTGVPFLRLVRQGRREDILSHAYGGLSGPMGAHLASTGSPSRPSRRGSERRLLGDNCKRSWNRRRTARTACVGFGYPSRMAVSARWGSPRSGIGSCRWRSSSSVEPIFEADFCEHSYGFRPKRSAHDAVKAVADGLFQGRPRSSMPICRNTSTRIPHAKLMAVVGERIVDGGILALIQQWLKAPVIEEDERGKRRPGGGKGQSERERRKAGSSPRCWQTSTCICWTGSGNGTTWSGGWALGWCAMPTMQ